MADLLDKHEEFIPYVFDRLTREGHETLSLLDGKNPLAFILVRKDEDIEEFQVLAKIEPVCWVCFMLIRRLNGKDPSRLEIWEKTKKSFSSLEAFYGKMQT